MTHNMKNKKYFAVILWLCVFAPMSFSYAQMETESAEGVPAGISDSDYPRYERYVTAFKSIRIA